MGVLLDERYQVDCCEAVERDLKETKKAGVISPTGVGKSYIALKLIENRINKLSENKKMLWVEPSSLIIDHILEIIDNEYSEEDKKMLLSKVKFTTYNQIYADMQAYKIDTSLGFIILDEVHRSGAEKWGEAIDELLKQNGEAELFAMTATPVRSDGRNMMEERVGKTSYELKLSDAVALGILNLPVYITSRYFSEDDIDNLEDKIELVDDKNEKKDLQEKLIKIRKQIENGKGLKQIITNNLKEYTDGKFAVFCNPGDDIEAIQEQAIEEGWFDDININQSFFALESIREDDVNEQSLVGFHDKKIKGNEDEKYIKTLWVKNMYNEGVRDEELDAEIMLRPTKSYILFLQQLGRIMSKDKENMGVVLDLVGNIKYFKDFYIEVMEITRKGVERGDKRYTEKVKEQFRIMEEQEDFIKDFEYIEKRVDSYINIGTYLKNAQEIELWCIENFSDKKQYERRLPSSSSKDEKERKLGYKLSNIRQTVLKKYNGKKIDEIDDEVDKEIAEIVNRLDEEYGGAIYLKNALEIEDWCKENNANKKIYEKKLPNQVAKDIKEKKLANKLNAIRTKVLKQYEGKSLEEIENEDDRKIAEIIRKLDDEYKLKDILRNALEIEEWCEENNADKKMYERKLPSANSKDEKERTAGSKLSDIRNRILKQYEGKNLDEIEDEDDKKIVEIIRRLDKEYGLKDLLKNALEIEEWCEENYGDKKIYERKLPSEKSKNEEEKRLGLRIRVIRASILRKYEGKEIDEIEDEDDRKIVEIIRRLNKEYGLGARLKSALEIEEWCKENYGDKDISERKLPINNAKDEKEKALAGRLAGIKYYVLKKYEGIELEEIGDEEDRKIVEIIRRLEEEYTCKGSIKKVLEIEEWCKENCGDKDISERRLPSRYAKDERERILAERLRGIKRTKLEQYEGIDLEDIEVEYDRKVVEIIRRIDEQYNTKRISAQQIGKISYDVTEKDASDAQIFIESIKGKEDIIHSDE